MGKKTKANAYNIIREPLLNLLRVIKEKKLVTNYTTLILLKKITKSIQFASLIAGSRSLELRNILKSKSSFSFFPYFISAFHSSSLISFSVCYVVSLLQYYIYIYFFLFSLNLFLIHNFFYFFFSSSLSLSIPSSTTITQPLTVVIQLPSPCIIHSFVRFLNSLQPLLFRYITAKMERLSRKEEHLVTENWKLGYSNLTHRSRCER